MSAIRRLSQLSISAVVALGFIAIASTTPVQAAATEDDGVTTHRGGVYGRLIGVKHADENSTEVVEKSTATPVGGNSSADPTGATPGRVSIYNTGTGQWTGLARIWTKKWGATRFTAQTWAATVDVGDPLHFNLTFWNARYKFQLYEDVNGNGVIDAADRLIRNYRISTSRAWARRHFWATRQRDVVVTGAGSGGGGNPPPVTQYPKGAIVSVNGRQASQLTRIDYTVDTTTLAFAYPNITFGNWAYEAFPSWYGTPAKQVTEKVTWSDNGTQTKVVSAPTSSTADPTVTTFTGP